MFSGSVNVKDTGVQSAALKNSGPVLKVRRQKAQQHVRCEAQVTVVGAGAAGLTAAFFAAEAGAEVLVKVICSCAREVISQLSGSVSRKVTLLERQSQTGSKILISGGTRCNVLPMSLDLQRDYFTESSRSALRAIFASWTLEGCKEWLESQIKLPLATEPDSNKYFPVSNSGQEVRNKLLACCLDRGVKLQTSAGCSSVQPDARGGWNLGLANGAHHEAERVVLATGGMSFPRMGTDGTGHRIAEDLGHSLHPPYPALVPLLSSHPAGQQLAGRYLGFIGTIAHASCFWRPRQAASDDCQGNVEQQHRVMQCIFARQNLSRATICCPRQKGVGLEAHLPPEQGSKRANSRKKVKRLKAERGGLLFTHRGMSGPAVLDMSHHAVMSMHRRHPQPALQVNWLEQSAEEWQQVLQPSSRGASSLGSVLQSARLPQRLAACLCSEAGADPRVQIAQLQKGTRTRLVELLTAYKIPFTGHEGFPKAEVTGGGVALSDIDAATMQSRHHNHLYMCGEILDVFGRIGGFNFYWAWLTGRLAGISAAKLPAS